MDSSFRTGLSVEIDSSEYPPLISPLAIKVGRC